MNHSLTALALLLPSFAFAQSLEISEAYAFQPNPASKNGAVFMRIDNPTESPIRVMGVNSDAAMRVELHTNEMDGDLMKMMELQDGLEIPAGSCALLERGGFHVMLMGLEADLVQDESIDVVLTLDSGEELNAKVPVDLEHGPTDIDDDCVRADAAKMMSEGHEMSDGEHMESMDHDDMNHDDMDHD